MNIQKNLTTCSILAFGFITVLVLSGCDPFSKESPQGFSLPEGNKEDGKAAFARLGCNACHFVPAIPQLTPVAEGAISIELGGEGPKIKTYADLVTSIINPSHRFAKGYPLDQIQRDGISNMPVYNNVMTVEELVDLVTFLQPHYRLERYHPTNYPHYLP